MKQAGADANVQEETLSEITVLLKDARAALMELEKVTAEVSEMPDGQEKAQQYYHVVHPAMDALRDPVDQLEMIVDKEAWPMPSYGDLIFEV